MDDQSPDKSFSRVVDSYIFRIQALLISDQIKQRDLDLASKWFIPRHYDEVVEERSVVGVCGFPLCNNIINGKKVQRPRLICNNEEPRNNIDLQKFCSLVCLAKSSEYQKSLSKIPPYRRDIAKSLDAINVEDFGDDPLSFLETAKIVGRFFINPNSTSSPKIELKLESTGVPKNSTGLTTSPTKPPIRIRKLKERKGSNSVKTNEEGNVLTFESEGSGRENRIISGEENPVGVGDGYCNTTTALTLRADDPARKTITRPPPPLEPTLRDEEEGEEASFEDAGAISTLIEEAAASDTLGYSSEDDSSTKATSAAPPFFSKQPPEEIAAQSLPSPPSSMGSGPSVSDTVPLVPVESMEEHLGRLQLASEDMESRVAASTGSLPSAQGKKSQVNSSTAVFSKVQGVSSGSTRIVKFAANTDERRHRTLRFNLKSEVASEPSRTHDASATSFKGSLIERDPSVVLAPLVVEKEAPVVPQLQDTVKRKANEEISGDAVKDEAFVFLKDSPLNQFDQDPYARIIGIQPKDVSTVPRGRSPNHTALGDVDDSDGEDVEDGEGGGGEEQEELDSDSIDENDKVIFREVFGVELPVIQEVSPETAPQTLPTVGPLSVFTKIWMALSDLFDYDALDSLRVWNLDPDPIANDSAMAVDRVEIGGRETAVEGDFATGFSTEAETFPDMNTQCSRTGRMLLLKRGVSSAEKRCDVVSNLKRLEAIASPAKTSWTVVYENRKEALLRMADLTRMNLSLSSTEYVIMGLFIIDAIMITFYQHHLPSSFDSGTIDDLRRTWDSTFETSVKTVISVGDPRILTLSELNMLRSFFIL